jgi:hypothetical protein
MEMAVSYVVIEVELMKVNMEGKLYCPLCTKVYRAQFDWAIQEGIEHHEANTSIFSDAPVWLKVKTGPYGRFAGCSNFPKCKYSISLEPKKPFIDYEDELRPY